MSELKRFNIYIPIEIKLREFVSQIYLGAELANRGHSVFVGSHAAIFSLLDSKNKQDGVYFDKGTQTLARSQEIRKRVEKMVILDQELSPAWDPEAFRHVKNVVLTRFYPGTEKYVDLFFTIDDPFTSDAVSLLGSELVVESGWPRFEFLTIKSGSYYQKEISSIRNKYGEFSLFTSNFFVIDDIDSAATSDSDTFKGVLGMSQRGLQLEIKKAEELGEIFRNWRKLGYSETIVARPHLSESVRSWKRILGSIPNVHIVRSNEIYPWLHAASKVIHFGSTSAIQASLIDKPVFAIDSLAGVHQAGLPFQLSDGIVGIGRPPSQYSPLLKSPATLDRVTKLMSRSSIERIANCLVDLNLKAAPSIHSHIRFLRVAISVEKLRRSIGLIRDELKRFCGTMPVNTQLQNIPYGITKIEASKVIKRLDLDTYVRVRQLGINLIVLNPKHH